MTVRFTPNDQALLAKLLAESQPVALVGFNAATLTKARLMGWMTSTTPWTPDVAHTDLRWSLTPVGRAFAEAFAKVKARDDAFFASLHSL
jgi:hypothetical protein